MNEPTRYRLTWFGAYLWFYAILLGTYGVHWGFAPGRIMDGVAGVLCLVLIGKLAVRVDTHPMPVDDD